jgi:hypothetical protein
VQPVRRTFRAAVVAWRSSRVSEAAIGRYVILFASLLHIGWAVLLVINPTAGQSTPVAIVIRVCGGPYRSAAVLVACALVAMVCQLPVILLALLYSVVILEAAFEPAETP